MKLTGTLYLPDAALTINNGANTQVMALVVSTVTFQGGATFNNQTTSSPTGLSSGGTPTTFSSSSRNLVGPEDLNLQPTDYESAALTIELRAREDFLPQCTRPLTKNNALNSPRRGSSPLVFFGHRVTPPPSVPHRQTHQRPDQRQHAPHRDPSDPEWQQQQPHNRIQYQPEDAPAASKAQKEYTTTGNLP